MNTTAATAFIVALGLTSVAAARNPPPVCAADETCFIAFGDQGTGNANQMLVAKAMTAWVADPRTRTDFIIGLGDNFYELGVHSCDSKKFTERFEEPYKDIKKKFYMSIGNHDVFMSTEAKPENQVCYAKTDAVRPQAEGPRFVMPDLYYTFTEGDVQFFVIYTPGLTMQSLWIRDRTHLEWLDAELRKSKARWKIVYGHGPIFSHGEHGHSKMLAHKVLPLLAKHHVDAYFAGHEHNQQHLHHPTYPDLEFFVSGTGGKTGTMGHGELSKWPLKAAWSQNRAKQLGFAYVRLSRHKIKVDLMQVDSRGRVIANPGYSFERAKQSGTAPVPPRLECAEPSLEESMELCYPKCRSGFKGVGPVCWQACPEGYSDDGASCRKDVDIKTKEHYGRGAGYVAWKRDKCEAEHRGGCEKHGLMWYPKCRAGFRAVGCCICRERSCPRGYKDDGATCRRNAHIFFKKSYGRGVGKMF